MIIKRIYISLPISGRNIEEVKKACLDAKAKIEKCGYEAVSPLEVSDNPSATYSEHMGKDIAALLDCDAAVFLDGWMGSKGCTLEFYTCQIYGKHILYGLNSFAPNVSRQTERRIRP